MRCARPTCDCLISGWLRLHLPRVCWRSLLDTLITCKSSRTNTMLDVLSRPSLHVVLLCSSDPAWKWFGPRANSNIATACSPSSHQKCMNRKSSKAVLMNHWLEICSGHWSYLRSAGMHLTQTTTQLTTYVLFDDRRLRRNGS